MSSNEYVFSVQVYLKALVTWYRLMTSRKFDLSGSQSLFSFFGNGDLDTLLSWEGDQSLFAAADDENVAQSGGESSSGGILNNIVIQL